MCGSTSAQNQSQSALASLTSSMSSAYSSILGSDSAIFNELNGNLSSIVNAGPGQQGFSSSELASMNTQAIQQAGTSYQNEMQAANESSAAKGGGAFVPSGAQAQIQEQAGSAAETQEMSALNQITQENYKQGNQNYWNAVGSLSGLGNVFNSATSAGSAAVGAGSAFGSEANAIQQADTSWEGLLGGVLSGAVGGASNLASDQADAGGGAGWSFLAGL